MNPKVKVINKGKRLAVLQRNKRGGVRLKVEEASIGPYKCEFCWLRGKNCIDGRFCFSAAYELGLYSVKFVRI
jgi:hypothetical protein